MSAGHFGQTSLFLPLYAILELPYLNGAQDLARIRAFIVAYDQELSAIEFRINAWRDKIAKVSYPGRSPETADFAILAIMTPLDEPVVP